MNREWRERPRRGNAVPEPGGGPIWWRGELGCTGICVLLLVIYLLTGSLLALGTMVLALLLLGQGIRVGLSERAFLRRVDHDWVRQGKRCPIVYSESDLWLARVSRWIEVLGHSAVVLNRSKQAEATDFTVMAFRRFCGYKNHSPAIVVFQGDQRPLVYRFYNAFRESKFGRHQYVEEQERAAFAALGLEAPCALTMR